MLKIICLIVVVVVILIDQTRGDAFQATLGHIKTKTSPEIQEEAVLALIKRLIPERADEFRVQIISDLGPEEKDTFQIVKLQDGTVHLLGTTGVAVATAFNYYLKYYCFCHVSWETVQLDLPKNLPYANITITLNDRFRYYQNVCTTSYSFVWWDWAQWEKHIDWMALNSFNLVLAFNGQEAIWQRVYEKFNLTQDEIDGHFSGPAFLSWLRMGNMRRWGGPLSQFWHQRSLALQKSILARLRSLGIIPVLPGFAGHLPRAFKRLYPNTSMVKMGVWNRFNDSYCCPYFLDPTDELFEQIGKRFVEEQIEEYGGTDHVYSCDSFNENTPASSDLEYLANVGKAIYRAISAADSEAIWLMQNWLFVHEISFWTRNRAKAILTSVPKGKMIVLDLQSEQFPQYERLNQYFGQPYIWCMLHNFGGTLGMFGSSDIINEEPIRARHSENSTMIGTGLTPEGIYQNYVIYELIAETAWRTQPVDLIAWFKNYTIRRYGVADANAIACWTILQKTVYNFKGLQRIRGHYAITRSPSLKIPIWNWYSLEDFLTAWSYLLEASPIFNKGFRHDLVDLTRQALQLLGDQLYGKITDAFNKKNLDGLKEQSGKFLELLNDLEEILASNENFLLGKWLKSAKDAANSSQDQDLFEYNARNQITLWGPNGEIMNYANKQWSGVVSHFFMPRWRLFLDYLNATLVEKTPFNQSKIKEKLFKEAEEPFTLDRGLFPSDPFGDSVEIARKIHGRWARKRRGRTSYEEFAGDVERRPKILQVD